MANHPVFRAPLKVTIFLLTAMMIGGLWNEARANPLKVSERQARQLAVHILNSLKPVESWLDSAPESQRRRTETRQIVEVTGGRVNLRTAPSVQSEVIEVAERGNTFDYVDFDGEWYLIQLDNRRRAYISADFSQLRDVEIQTTAAAPPPRMAPENIPRARIILEDNAPAVTTLQRLARNAEMTYARQFGGKAAEDGTAQQQAAATSLKRIQKYARITAQKYETYANLVGGVKPVTASKSRLQEIVRGTVRAGLGTNTREQEIVGGATDKTDVTRTEVAADLTARLSPDDKLQLRLGHNSEIRFAPSSRTRGELDYSRRVGDIADLGARAGFRKYQNDQNDLNDFDRTEFGVRGSVKPSKKFQGSANLDFVGASYPNNAGQDYKETRLNLALGGEASSNVQWGARYSLAAHDREDNTFVEDNARSRLEGSVQLRTGERAHLSFSAHSEGYSFDSDNNPANYSRRGLQVKLRNLGRPGNSNTLSLEIQAKDHEVIDDRNYTEFRGDWQATRRATDTESRTRTFVNYRNYKGSESVAYLDYLEGRFDQFRRRAAIFWESNWYLRYFFEENDLARNARVNQFLWFGLALGDHGAIQVGPHLATNTELVTVDGAVDTEGNELGTFENPNNSVRYGIKSSAQIKGRLFRARLAGRYEMTEFYNRDNAQSPSRFELEGNMTYQISRKIDASARAKYYTSGADDPGSRKTSELDILFGLIYRLGG